ncbi:MAG: hypothetical protein ACTIJY_02220 [Luteimonas sp.]
MHDDLTIAVGELHQAIRHAHWQGKTYRQFWTWFNNRCIEIVGMAETADLDALGVALLEVRDAIEAGGYMVGSDRLDDTIDAEE